MQRAKGGDPEAFGDLVRLYEGPVIRLGLQMGLSRDDALDACQDAFIKAFKYIARFESGRSFFKWLYRIAIHAAYDQMRHAKGGATVSLDDLETGPHHLEGPSGPGIHERLESAQLLERVRGSLDCLTRRERIVFVLRDLQDLPTEEIGAILRLSQITVRRHCSSARRKLRSKLFPRSP